jgi:hypothetical protein
MIGFLRQCSVWSVCWGRRHSSQARSQNFAERLLASLCLSVRLSVCSSVWNNSASTRRIFIKLDIWIFFENLSRNMLCMISGFRYEVDENCNLLGCYAASSGNCLMTFQDNLSVPWVQNSKGILESGPLKMGQLGCPETSVRNYRYSLYNNAG